MSTSVADLDRFTDQVARWTTHALQRRPTSFGGLIRALPGVDPGLVADALTDLASGSQSTALRLRAASLLAEALVARCDSSPSPLPVPHPLDCYWPSDPMTLRALTTAIADNSPAGGSVAYLAWPNAFAEARRRLPERRHLLLEHDEARAHAHRIDAGADPDDVRNIDILRDRLPAVRADMILADPPWYPLELKAFLWAAAAIAAPGAVILLALPPLGTRPGIELERRDVLDWAARCGLRPRGVQSGVLGYLTPPFERAALVARGIPGTPDDWRRGDLLALDARPSALPERPPVPLERWHAARVAGLPMRVRVDDPPSPVAITATSLLGSLVDGDVLATVSRRTAVRKQTRLWTSRNRVFATAHPELLAAIIDALAEGRAPVAAAGRHLRRRLTATETAAVRGVASRLHGIIELERREHGLTSA
jgi:hypothetical protein